MSQNKKTPLPHLTMTGIPKRALDKILHYLVMEKIHTADQNPALYVHEKHSFVFFHYYKHFRMLSRIKGTALCLLQTQYAKKPKNPV